MEGGNNIVEVQFESRLKFQPVQSVTGVFEAAQCIECHDAITPGIVADWRASARRSSR